MERVGKNTYVSPTWQNTISELRTWGFKTRCRYKLCSCYWKLSFLSAVTDFGLTLIPSPVSLDLLTPWIQPVTDPVLMGCLWACSTVPGSLGELTRTRTDPAGLEAAYLPARVWALSVLPRWVWNEEWDKQGFSSIHTTVSHSSFECMGFTGWEWSSLGLEKLFGAGMEKIKNRSWGLEGPQVAHGRESTSRCRRGRNWSLGQWDPSPGGGNSHPPSPCWKNPWTEEPGSLNSRCKKSRTQLSNGAHAWWLEGHRSSLLPAHPTTVLSRLLSPRACALAWEQPQSRSGKINH